MSVKYIQREEKILICDGPAHKEEYLFQSNGADLSFGYNSQFDMDPDMHFCRDQCLREWVLENIPDEPGTKFGL